MKIAVLGTRGFPNVQGGVEAHCENLYPRLVALGCEVTVFSRRPYVDPRIDSYQGVKFILLPCPKNKFLEAFSHTFRGILAAKKVKPDLLHIHAIGPSLCVPLVRMLGMKVIMTHHGRDYERKKWNWFAKIVLRLGERLGVGFANQVIAVSETIADGIEKKYGRKAVVIPNGVQNQGQSPQPETGSTTTGTVPVLAKYGLKEGRYFLAVGRFVPEKGFHDLVDAFVMARNSFAMMHDKGWKLVIVGRADHEDTYSREFEWKAKDTPDVVLTGFLTGAPLQELYSSAGVFVLPSYYEGLPIVLLEAMSYGLSCVVSDIPANREVGLAEERYFKPGDVQALFNKMVEYSQKPLDEVQKEAQRRFVAAQYDWDRIAEKTLEVYKSV